MQEIISKKSIAARIKQLRLANKLSQEEFSKILGTSRSNFSQIELGKQYPTYDSLFNIAKYFNKSYDWILHGNEVIISEKQIEDVPNMFKNDTLSDLNSYINHSESAEHPFISLVSINAQKEYLQNLDVVHFLNQLPQISCPLKNMKKSFRAFEIPESNNQNQLFKGDIVICSKVIHFNSCENSVYLWVTINGIFVSEMISFYEEAQSFLLVAKEDDSKPILLPKNQIKEIWLVKAKYSSVLQREQGNLILHLSKFEYNINQLKEEIVKLKERYSLET